MEPSGVTELPDELLLPILEYLPTRRLLDLTEISSEFRRIGEHNRLWYNYFIRDIYPVSYDPRLDFKQLYEELYSLRGKYLGKSLRELNIELLEAAEMDNILLVEALLFFGANVNTTDQYDWTPLHIASDNGRKEIVEILLASGANINATTQNGSTPLHWASENGHKEIVEILLDYGANVNATDRDGQTPLHFASNREIKEILQRAGGY